MKDYQWELTGEIVSSPPRSGGEAGRVSEVPADYMPYIP